MTARAWLFVPGDMPAKMEKALASGADALILDLEDSVSATRKPEARAAVRDFLAARRGLDGPELWVRINPLSSEFAQADLAVVGPALPFGIVLPKPDSAQDAMVLGAMLSEFEAAAGGHAPPVRILPIATETPIALFRLDGYASAGPRLAGLTWGAEDLSTAVGAISARDEAGRLTPLFELARSLTIAGAAAANVEPIETVYPDFRDLEGLRAYAARGRRDGFTGMMAIHPTQVAVINEVFSPSAEELDHARRIVELFAANPDAGALKLDGKMVDAPHLTQARRLLERA
jgi:citrate lyase subunit beta/citryl-CoA lyase